MGVVGVAFAPGAPVLVPEAALGASSELAELRAAAVQSVESVMQRGAHRFVVVGASDADGIEEYPGGSVGSLAGLGVPLTAMLGPAAPAGSDRSLPLSVTIGAWLLRYAGWNGATEALALGHDADAIGRGKQLHDDADHVGLLVVGEGSARLTTASPGYLHPDALRWQQGIDPAFRRGDREALLDITEQQAADLMVSGRAPWQLAAAAVGDAAITVAQCAIDDRYGVGYVAASWICA